MVNIKINDVPISVEEGNYDFRSLQRGKNDCPYFVLFKRYQRNRCLPCLRCGNKRYRKARHFL